MPRKKTERIDSEMKAAAVAAYQLTGTLLRAGKVAGCSRRTLNNEMNRDPKFMEAMKDAKATFGEGLEDLALKRILDEKFKGSTILLMQRLNAELPEKYKHRTETKIEGEIKVVTAVPRPAIDKPEVKRIAKKHGVPASLDEALDD